MRRFCQIALCVGFAACHDTPAGPHVVPVFHLIATSVWANSQLALTSSALSGAALPVVRIGGVTAAVTRVNDTTITATVPSHIGMNDVTVMTGPDTVAVGSISVGGFDAVTSIPGLMGVESLLPGQANTVIGNGDTGLAIVNVGTGAMTTYAESVGSANCSWGPAVTPDSTRFFFTMTDSLFPCFAAEWTTTPTLHLVDSLPRGALSSRLNAQLGPGRWLTTIHNFIGLTDSATASATSINGNIDRVVISPSGGRAAMNYCCFGGVPVIDATTATVAYRLPADFAWSSGAAFSPSGDTLFMAVGDSASLYSGRHFLLLAVRASDGLVLDSTALNLDTPGAVSLDPGGKWIYVSGIEGVGQTRIGASLVILERKTLRTVATLEADSADVSLRYHSSHLILLDPVNHQGYVLDTDIRDATPYNVGLGFPFQETAAVFRFTIP